MKKRSKKKLNLLRPENFILNLSLILTTIALLTAIPLDYLSFKKGRVYYLGWNKIHLPTIKITTRPARPGKEDFQLAEYLKLQLQKAGFPENRFSILSSDDGRVEIVLELEEKEFKKLKPELLKSLKKKKIDTKLTETRKSDGQVMVSFEIFPPGAQSGRLILKYRQDREVAVSLPPMEKSAPTPSPIITARKSIKKVALVIDDMGSDLDFLQELINLQVPLTVAILPDALFASRTAELAQENGLEVILHLPLEALNGQSYAGADGLIRSSMTPEEIRAILERDLSIISQATGLNNHMGSRATADRYLMEIILDFLKEKNLFFLDSKTNPRSIAYELAVKKGVPALSRHVFLDADENRTEVKKRLDELLKYAQKHGQAVGIGHPFPETLEALRHYREEAARLGLEPVKLSDLLR